MCMLLIASSWTSSTMAEKKMKPSLIYIVGPITSKSFSYILLKFALQVANNQFSDQFNNGSGLLWSVRLLLVNFNFYVL